MRAVRPAGVPTMSAPRATPLVRVGAKRRPSDASKLPLTIHAAPFRELRLERLCRDFGTVNALRDVTLTVAQGEFIALLGPSGCGKSTTLNCIAGLLPLTGGGIWLDERRIDRPQARRSAASAWCSRTTRCFPHMSVRKNVGFGLMMRGVAKAEVGRRVEEAIGLVRLQGQEHKLPGQLSGGQQQRVAIARAIVVEPPLVLMDEPLSNLDAKLRLEMRAEIRRIHNALGATTIYVTHDQEEALSLADRIVVLRDGAVRQVGTPEDLFARPDHLDVAEFMGFRNRAAGPRGRGRGRSRGGGRERHAGDGARPRAACGCGEAAVATVRPEDLHPVEGGGACPPPSSRPSTAAASSSGSPAPGRASTCSFRSGARLEPGSPITLGADPERVLVYPGGVS